MNKNHQKNARSLRRITTILAVFTLLFCAAGCSKKTPREALEAAYEKTFVENHPTESLLGLSDITAHLNDNKAYSTGLSLSIQELTYDDFGEYAGLLSGLGLSVDSAYDLLNRKSAGSIDITYGGTTYLTFGGLLQGSKVHVTSPQLLDGSLSLDLSTMEEDLASDSMLGAALREGGVSLPENFTEELLNSLTNPSTLNDMVALTAACEDLDDAVLVEELDKKTVSLTSDVAYKTAYSVTIPKDAYTAVVDAALEAYTEYSSSLTDSLTGEETADAEEALLELKEALEEITDRIGDLVFTVTVTKDGYINYAETTVTDDEDSYVLTAAFNGETVPLADVEICFLATVDEATYEASYEESFDTKNNEFEFAFTVKQEDTTLFTVSSEGALTDVEKGKKYGIDFDYLEFETEGFSVSLSGDYYVDITECEITAPTGTEYPILRMSEDEFTELFMEVYTNLMEDPNLSTVLSLLGM